jgi:uncharacterized membrane protein YuzA (DUF378 family)
MTTKSLATRLYAIVGFAVGVFCILIGMNAYSELKKLL